uniref:Uncharacterized protein n=1 Tax=Rhizophora mucronata TaxID=61149 RepID=A0A2P2LJS5_RHIMU
MDTPKILRLVQQTTSPIAKFLSIQITHFY